MKEDSCSLGEARIGDEEELILLAPDDIFDFHAMWPICGTLSGTHLLSLQGVPIVGISFLSINEPNYHYSLIHYLTIVYITNNDKDILRYFTGILGLKFKYVSSFDSKFLYFVFFSFINILSKDKRLRFKTKFTF